MQILPLPRRSAKLCGSLVLAAFVFGLNAARAQYFAWTGGSSTNVTVSSNYYGGAAPTFGGSITAGLTVENGSNNAFIYTTAQGTSTFSGYVYIGQNNVGNALGAGTVSVTGGTVNFGSASNTGSLNQNVIGLATAAGSGVLNVSGGTVNFLAGLTENSKTTSLWIGNAGNGTVNLSGGEITTQNGLNLARDSGIAVLNISGSGLFDVQGTDGTLAKTNTAYGTATINLGAGSGIFRESNSAAFAGGINLQFSHGTGSQFQLKTSTEPFAALAAAGELSYQKTPGGAYTVLDDTPADTSAYYLDFLAESYNSGTGFYILSVPEPSTWLTGALCLGVAAWRLGRRIRQPAAHRG